MDERHSDDKNRGKGSDCKSPFSQEQSREDGGGASTRMEELAKVLSTTGTSINLFGDAHTPKEEARSRDVATHVLLEFGKENAFQLVNPFSVVVDASGDVLVLDQPERDRYRISRFGSGGLFKMVVACMEKGSSPGKLLYPKGIVLDDSGNIYIPDAGNNRVQRFSPEGKFLCSVGELGERPGQFDFPCDVEIDSNGSLYVADTGNCRVQQVTARGIPLLLFGVDKNGLPDDSDPELDEPLGVTRDGQGCVYVADTNHHRIVKYDPNGKLALVFGEEGEQPGKFQGPSDVHVLANGHIYVADRGNTRVQIFDTAGTFQEQFQIDGSERSAGDSGDVAVDEDGYVYICDRVKNVVVKVELLTSPEFTKGVKLP